MNLRELARGKPCMVRVPGVCNYNPETTVLAHVRMVGISGMGVKAPDVLGAWACNACHDYCDNRGYEGDPYSRRLMLLEGVMRTQCELLKLGRHPLTEAPVVQK